MTREQKLKALHILSHYSSEHQLLKCVEELSELSAAIMKHIDRGGNQRAIFEEIVDVEIMVEQVKGCLPYADNDYDAERNRKLDRQLNRLKGE